eukprot:Blabericola_migrator_1__2863@NODE_181_length_11864_cov_121_034161_g157_i0_p1_GENE_NODE_181_length_11864_cov_121_034161_g157_i0NODE_181_length_11864_cov_121_034161_g157_i0_p1_ORF_typecomplete_len1260_score178_26PPDK_N/PF01326_19/6_2e37CBM_20/PF00686_19/1_8e16CBM_20/PF00686_19/7_6e03DUF410/PF04190_13/0_093_NODE_181_length_11864_cov_121_034161_g157_i047098488
MEVPSPVVVFECHCAETCLGESVLVTGCIRELGDWQIQSSTPMITSAKEFPLWRSKIFQLTSVEPDADIEFKFFIQRQNQAAAPKWETCPNRRFRCPKPGQLARVVARFGNDSSVAVNITEISSANSFGGAEEAGFSNPVAAARRSNSLSEQSHNPFIDVTSPPKRVGTLHPEEAAASSLFTATEDASCAYSRSEYVCQYFVHNNSTVNAAQWIATLNKNNGSLRQKCAVIRDFLKDTSQAWRSARSTRKECWNDQAITHQLISVFAYSTIYLSWVSSSVIRCSEDGGHHRPNQVALVAKDIVNICEKWKYLNAVARQTVNEHVWEADLMDYFCRQLVPFLPSFKSSFTCAVPLTRIRDIAHRNDICQDLKREIKTTLQNKLHRCAGPEDLIKSKELLDRFHRNPENYPPNFIREFEIFHSELTEFFNADDLEERLNKLLKAHPETNPWRVNAINRFVANKFSFESDKRNSQHLHHLIRSSTHLREALLNEIYNCGYHPVDSQEDTLRVEFFSQDPSHGQSLRIAEIQTEGYLFSLYSRFINDQADIVRMFDTLAPAQQLRWLVLCLSLLCDALKNLVISGFAAQYCCLLIKEIRSVLESDVPPLMNRLFLLHVASMFRRAMRLVQTQADLLLSLLPPRDVESFAIALGVDANMGRIYTEGAIRSSLAFQIARLSSAVLSAVEIKALKKSPFQTLSEGIPSGMVVFGTDIESIKIPPQVSGDIIIVLGSIDGDEELDGLSDRLNAETNAMPRIRVVGLLGLQDVPTLSHIGVRARQLKLPFVSVSVSLDQSAVIKEWQGKLARMDCDEASQSVIPLVHIQSLPAQSTTAKGPILQKQGSLILHSNKTSIFKICKGAEIEAGTCGTKATACQELFATLQTIAPPPATPTSARNGEKTNGSLAAGSTSASSSSSNTPTASVYYQAPKCIALPFGCMEAALSWPQNAHFAPELKQLLHDINTLPPGRLLSVALQKFRYLLETNLHVPSEIEKMLSKSIVTDLIHPDTLYLMQANRQHQVHVMVRSSSNCEDLKNISGAGLYESVLAAVGWEGPAPDALDLSDMWNAIKQVWSSLYSERAVLSRKANRIRGASMAILIQPLVPATWSFIAHTKCLNNFVGLASSEASCPSGSPLANINLQRAVYIEMARGLGEALASGGADLGGGKPTQLVIDGEAGGVVLNLWDMFGRYRAPQSGSHLERIFTTLRGVETRMEYWNTIGKLLSGLKGLERLFGGPQDIEGCVVEDDDGSMEVHILQSRPQQI